MLEKGGNMKTYKDYYGNSAFFMGTIINKLEEVYTRYGYDSIYTPLLEKKSFDEKQESIFSVVGSDGDQYSLKFDSTLSLKRLIADHDDIVFPFKRYQIQKSFRKAGRDLNEFYQCDADIIKSKTKNSDAEIIQIASEGLNNVGLYDHSININHKKIIDALNNNKTIDFEEVSNKNIIESIDILLSKELNSDIKEGLSEIKEIVELLPKETKKKCKLNFDMTEDADYYTGIVFNGVVDTDEPKVLLRGGRYDELIKDSNNNYLPSVGMAYVLEDVLDVLKVKGKDKKCNCDRIIFYLQDDNIEIRNEALARLREKYEVLTVSNEDLSIKEFIDYSKENNARLIGIIKEEALELYRVEEFDAKFNKKETKTLKYERKED